MIASGAIGRRAVAQLNAMENSIIATVLLHTMISKFQMLLVIEIMVITVDVEAEIVHIEIGNLENTVILILLIQMEVRIIY